MRRDTATDRDIQYGIAAALERIADTLDDFMDMSLSMQAISRSAADDPQRALDAIGKALADIAKKRAAR